MSLLALGPSMAMAQSDDFGALLDGVLSGMGAAQTAPAGKKQAKAPATIEGVFAEFDKSTTAGSRSGGDPLLGVLDAYDINAALTDFETTMGGPGKGGSFTATYNPAGLGRNPYTNYRRPTMPGDAVLPISGRLTSGFGYRPKFGRMHKGVDIALQVGDTVVAAIEGTVTRVSTDQKGYGIFVCLSHPNGMETRYAHLSRPLVAQGMRVRAGDPIALGGNTGNSTGPHLHFETRVDGQPVDPTTLFNFKMPGGVAPHRSLASLDAENPRIGGVMAAAATGASTKSTYVVRPGDTLESVARKHNVSVLTLCRLNMLNSADRLTPGRMLKLR